MAVRQHPGSVREKRRGLGDAVEMVAQPIARALGLPTDCEPCKQRKQRLNAISDTAADRMNALGRRIFRRK